MGGFFIKVNRVVFSWLKKQKDLFDVQNINRIDIIFEEGQDVVICIDAGKIKIEDRSLKIDTNYVLKRISEIDFGKSISTEYSGDSWQLYINDTLYEGFLGDPEYVRKVKKIIRFNEFQLYAIKKVAGYLKS